MRRALTTSLIALLAILDLPAQSVTPGQDVYPNNYPPALPSRKGPGPPRLQFDPLGEIAIPGPLPAGPLVLDQGRLRLEVAGGTAWIEPRPGATPEIRTPGEPEGRAVAAPGSTEPWVVSPSGDLRFRIDGDGRIRAQRRSRWSRDGWRRAWTIRTPSAIPTPPRLIGRRLFFAGLDDRIYAVRADNGHRLWAADLGERVSRPLAHWGGTIASIDPATRRVRPEALDVLLVVPDSGASIQALDAYDGAVVASLPLPPSQGWLTSTAVVVDESRVAVARQGYEPEQAALALFALRSPEAQPGPDPPSGGSSPQPPL